MQVQGRETISIRVERDVPVTMRDGTVLMTDVYRQAAEGRYPVLLQRTPYNKETGGLQIATTSNQDPLVLQVCVLPSVRAPILRSNFYHATCTMSGPHNDHVD